MATGQQLLDINFNTVQRGTQTLCGMTFDGVLNDHARKTFRGTIDFRNGSAGSKGEEQENVLLLSNDVENRTMPVILCEEEDVEGSHGATIGQLDEQVLFYMATRGIDAAEAQVPSQDGFRTRRPEGVCRIILTGRSTAIHACVRRIVRRR